MRFDFPLNLNRLWSTALAAATAAVAFSASAAEPTLATHQILERYRQIIVLFADNETRNEDERANDDIVGKYLFHENLVALRTLGDELSRDIPARSGALERFLDDLEDNPEYFDADKLAFRDVFEDLLAQLQETHASDPRLAGLKRRLMEDRQALLEIQARYEKEVGKIFARMQTRALPQRRESWERYVTSLKARYTRADVIKAHADLLAPLSDTRGKGKGHSGVNEVFGGALPDKTVALTFDDGPHKRYTDRILAILKENDLHAMFFEVGQNVGEVKDGVIKLYHGADISRSILDAGHALANHTYTHAYLPKLNEAGLDREIDTTRALLENIAGQPVPLFRAPYGARNTRVLAKIKSEKLESIMWNIDSLDWSDPVPQSIVKRVMEAVEKEGRGIILFHDIHARTVDALPLVISALKEAGYRFASWDGQAFTLPTARGEAPPAPAAKARAATYRESFAVIIGVDDYDKWPKLRYAVNDARGVKDVLIGKYGFKPANVFTLFNQEATRQNILTLLSDKLADTAAVTRDDQVFIFFAGHGATRRLASGRDLGYIVPVDADANNYYGQAISMSNFQDIAEAIPAKHLFFVMDSCYSGLALTRGGARASSENFLQENARRSARQMLTAGGADQQVADGGPNGHSVFTWTLIQSLEGKADLNGDGVITASELAAYAGPVVSSLSLQTPAFGSLPGSEGGEFVFELKHDDEYLNSLSAQLDEDAIKLNGEIERVRAEIAAKTERNRRLQAQLNQARQELAQAPSVDPTPTASSLNDQGMVFYKQKQYPEALKLFLAAAELDPTHALATTNAGFVYYKLGQYEEALAWFAKALRLDPQRGIAYVNLGDAYLKLGRTTEAKQAFEKYLALAPSGRSATYVHERIAALAVQQDHP
jgi:peptidoglycan/xylan/chitin deacetylase (PgdA/CDA1 family)/uncharacterized caspase-like protein